MKKKLIIFNSLLMSVLVTLVIIFLISISDSVISLSSKSLLKDVLTENAEEIRYKNGEFDFSDVDFYEDQVSTLIYSSEGALLSGYSNTEIMEPLVDDSMRTVVYSGREYLIYDILLVNSQHDNLFLRGIITTSAITNTLNSIYLIILLMLPLFIIISGFGSYFICKKALLPLDKMSSTAKSISEGNDLSLRIGITKVTDEVSKLGMVFDKMLQKLEDTMNREKQFTSDVSHELRTPTAVILAECDQALHSEDVDMKNSIECITSQAKKMERLINSLLRLVRLDNGNNKPELSKIDFSDFIEELCKEQSSLIPSAISFEYLIDQDIILNIDYDMMSRVLINLIENSVKYMGDGNSIVVKLVQNGSHVILSVEDNGIGIDSSEYENIFERFYRIDDSRTDSKSMGLGLSMVKQLCELNGGTICVSSLVGKGTKFDIKFNNIEENKDEGI